MDTNVIGVAIAGLLGWGVWVTRKTFEAHECNKETSAKVEQTKSDIKVELEVLKERINNLIERLS